MRRRIVRVLASINSDLLFRPINIYGGPRPLPKLPHPPYLQIAIFIHNPEGPRLKIGLFPAKGVNSVLGSRRLSSTGSPDPMRLGEALEKAGF